MAACRRNSMVEIGREAITEEEYIKRQGKEENRPIGYEVDLVNLEKCREPKELEPEDGEQFEL